MLTSGWKISGLVLCLFILVPGVGQAAAQTAAVDSLSAAEWDGCLEWLHSLEQEVALRTEKGLEETTRLFPFDREPVVLGEPTPYRHLTIAKALKVLETQFPDPENARDLTPLVALANARNYVNLAEYDTALVWYDAAARLDDDGDLTSELRRETLAAAIAAGDSSRVDDLVTGMLAGGVPYGDRVTVINALRWSLTSGAEDQLAVLCDSLAAHPDSLNETQGYWLARGLEKLDRPAALYGRLRQLVRNGGLSLGLTEADRMWVLTSLADVSLRLGADRQARRLYVLLTESPLEGLNLWATYQLAGMDMMDGNYLAASTGYGTVCRAKGDQPWKSQACALAKINEDLERIRREGKPYGADRFSSR